MTRANPFETEDPWEATNAGDDPFGDEDPFENARDAFPNVEWVIDRLVLVWPIEILHLQGDNGPYDAMECRIAVLDGAPTDNMPKIPCEIVPFRFNSDSIVKDLKHLVGGTKPKLARVAEKPSKKNKNVMARIFREPSTQDIAIARKYMASQLHH